MAGLGNNELKEQDRIKRNRERLESCFPWFAERVARLIAALEADGERPRIQDAWRSPSAQLAAFHAGVSERRYGFHNVTGPHGEKQALAVDLLDDDHPTKENPPPWAYLCRLGYHARRVHLTTGLDFGLSTQAMKDALWAAVDAQDLTYSGKWGWDATHVQIVGLTPTQVSRGARPS